MKYIVKRYSQYKLGKAPFSYNEGEDKQFDCKLEANHYMRTADSGFYGDTRYRYELVEVSE